MRQGKSWTGDLHIRRNGGETFWANTTLAPVLDESGQLVHSIAFSSEAVEGTLAARRIERLAFHDELTGLPNKAYFVNQMKQHLVRARRDEHRTAVLLVDLDNFHEVNNRLGYEVGDGLLQRVASRLQAALRECDLVARLRGDEFGVVVDVGPDSVAAADMARRTINAIGKPFRVEDRDVKIEASVGISTFPDDAEEPEELLDRARRALRRGKQQGRARFHFYAPKLDATIRHLKNFEDELRAAATNGQLQLWYQPQVAAEGRLITGAEALIRWNHPSRGLLPPAEFIPLAEQSGQIVQIGAWALHEASRQLAEWQSLGLPEVDVAVNVSAIQFRRQDLVQEVRSALASSGIVPQSLTLEITESVVLQQTDRNLEVLNALRELGVRISLDDFGTGYSSLSYLTRFQVDKIKVDRSFVNQVLRNPVHIAIIDAVVNLGRVLGARINVEGVETQEQLELLLAHKIDEIQGFYFSRPVPPDEFAELLLLNRLSSRTRQRDGQ